MRLYLYIFHIDDGCGMFIKSHSKVEDLIMWKVEEPEYFPNTKFPKSRYLIVNNLEQKIEDTHKNITEADCIVIDMLTLGIEDSLKWLNQLYNFSHSSHFQVPTVVVVGRHESWELIERYKNIQKIQEAGGIFYDSGDAKNIDEVIGLMKKRDQIKLEAFDLSELEYYYSSYLQ